MQEELKHLNYTLDKFDEVMADSKLKLSNLREIYKHDYDAMLDEKFKLENEITLIEKAKNTPYFARIDFDYKEKREQYYIGKLGISDYDNNIITVDWRAPISSLYYDSNVGDCSYEAPEGVISGRLDLKRQYTIENSKLIGFNDVDTVSNDELLKPYLSVSADNRLKNIVSTIQAEQNKIIREKIYKNLIIQGVAGSGKTTVALHRIAYLVYNNRDLYKPSDYMVIGPNKFFVSYISGILPDLDVNGVPEYTLEELFINYLNDKYVVNNSLDKIKNEDLVSRFKVSLEMKDKIDEYFDNLQVVYDNKLDNFEEISKYRVGVSVCVVGKVVLTPEMKQPLEVHATSVILLGDCPENYPIQPKRHTREFLREVAHLRPRTNLFSAVFRIRSVAAHAIHTYFQERGYIYVHTPLITCADCEGSDQMFKITTLNMKDLPYTEDGTLDYSKDLFSKQIF